MSFNPNKLTFKVDEITGEIIQPQVFLCDRQLNKIGEIYPVGDLRIKSVLNGADEISFRMQKNVSDTDNALYHKIKDYSVVFVQGFGYFEVSPTVNDTYTSIKTLNGNSLGESELSQLFCTLECNTSSDIENFGKLHPTKPYISTVLYSDSKEYSLIHRILTYAPNYTVGKVDDTIKNTQRTFSFSKKDIISCFSEIAQEIGCIFDIVVRRNEDGMVERVVNIYDAQYCGDCRSRKIANGVCQNCGSTNISGIGEDTNIAVGTDNLSDEITLTPDGNMKNCFIVEGGDDIITDAVQGILPSGDKKIYKFSEDTRLLFSPELKKAYEKYEKKFEDNKDKYANTLELEYTIFDLILYLQSGRMPTVETAERNLRDETIHLIFQFQNMFPDGLGIIDTEDITSKNSTVRQVFSLFVDNGYAVKQINGAVNKDSDTPYWTGDIVVYEIKNSDSKATIHVSKNSSYIEWVDGTTSNGVLSSSDKPENTINLSTWGINFTTDNDKYEAYLKQKIALSQKNYEYIKNLDKNTPKEWNKYSLNRLYSYYTGYEACIETLYETKKETNLPGIDDTADSIITSYQEAKNEISEYMSRIKEMIYYLYHYYDHDFNATTSTVPSGQDIDYTKYNIPENRKHFHDALTAFENMSHYIKWGTWKGGDESSITDHPLYCKDCGSQNVKLSQCLNPGCKGHNIMTYSEMADTIRNSYSQDSTSLEIQRKKIQEECDIRSNLGDKLYSELCSFIREDVYNNSNFISDGLSNSSLISKAKELVEKADIELTKACVSQHTLSGNIYAFAAYNRLDKKDFPIQDAYDKFRLGNFMRYFADDGKTYKLRLSSEEFSWADSGAELNVEFTDIIEYSNGGISDLASLMQTMGNLATSFDSVKKQSEQGVEANHTFQKIKNEGLQSALSNVLNARDLDVQIDEHGILLRKYDYELDDYDEHQMKLINRNIVMTNDNWKNANLAIGLGMYDEKLTYGVWADALVGNLIAGEKLVIKNEDSSVIIDKNGITIENGSISWDNVKPPEISEIDGLSTELSSIKDTTNAVKNSIPEKIAELEQKVERYLTNGGSTSLGENYMISPYIGGGYLNIVNGDNQVVIDPSNTSGSGYIFQVKNQDNIMVGIDTKGEALFEGEIRTKKGTIGGWNISENGIFHSNLTGNNGLDNSLSISSKESQIFTRKIYKEVKGNDIYFHDNTLSILPGKLEYLYKYICNVKDGVGQGDRVERSSLLTIQNDEVCINEYKTRNNVNKLSRSTFISSTGIYIKEGDVNDDRYFYDTRLTYEGLQIKGKYLGQLYSVVTTGVNQILGNNEHTEPWIEQTIEFGVEYRQEPMVNVMFYETQPAHENIVFKNFIINSNGNYSGFTYLIRNATPGFDYSTKWWAVGNIIR